MKVLLTGAFGNIGATTLQELLSRGYRVRCFDIPTKANRKFARRFKGDAEIFWGDLRSPEDTAAAVSGQDVVVHLGFVIPKLSVTGVNSEDDPEWARAINVGGTANLIAAMKAQTRPARIIFTSSLHVYGRTQDRPPPRTVADPPHPIEHYAKHKVACEKMVAESGLPWTIFRLGAALPVRLILDPGMFDVPLENRIEYVHARDVATAIANALESERVWGKTWLIGGGPGCQLHQRDIVAGVLEAVGLGMVPDEAFTTVPYPVDWLDTAESQRLLHFQTRTLDDYLADLTSRLGFRRHLIRLFRPILRAWLLSKSPVLRQVPGTSKVPGT